MNNDILKDLSALKNIKPDKDWVLSTKAFILEPEYTLEKSRSFSFRLQPALAIPVLMFIIIGSGVGIHLTLQKPELSYNSSTYLAMVEERLVSSMADEAIQEVGVMLDKATDKLSKTNDPAESAVIVEQISNINKKVAELEIEELMEKAQVLTSVASQTIENKIENTTQALVENLIKVLEIQELTGEDQELFTQAKIDYNSKNYNKALETILMLTNE